MTTITYDEIHSIFHQLTSSDEAREIWVRILEARGQTQLESLLRSRWTETIWRDYYQFVFMMDGIGVLTDAERLTWFGGRRYLPWELPIQLSVLSLPVPDLMNTVAYILIGQSNMVGRADQDGGSYHPAGVLMLARGGAEDGTLITPTNPLAHHDPNSGDMGLDVQFAIDWVADHPNDTLILIPGAEGGTGFSDNRWNPGDDLYEDIVDRANTFFAANPDVILGGILFHQGEKDMAAEMDPEAYAAALDAMVLGLRADIDVASTDTPFVAGQVLAEYAAFNGIRTEIQDLITSISDRVVNSTAVSSASLTDIGDTLHFDAASLRTLGSRYNSALAVAEAADGVLPGAPTGLDVTSDNANAYLSWTAPSDQGNPLVTSYSVERSAGGAGVWSEVGTATAPATSYVDSTVAAETTYDYQVSAINAAGTGAPSETDSTTTAAEASPLSVQAFDHGESGTDTNPTGAYTFSSLTTAPGLAIVVATVRGSGTVGVSSVTVAGVTATIIHTEALGTAQQTIVAKVPVAASSATVVVNTTGLVLRCGVSVWSVGPGDSDSVAVTAGQSSTGVSSLTVTPTGLADGLILAHITSIFNGTFSWTAPITQRLATTVIESTIKQGGADYATSADGTQDVTVTGSENLVNSVLVGVVVGPL